jgi:hypothetical protein
MVDTFLLAVLQAIMVAGTAVSPASPEVQAVPKDPVACSQSLTPEHMNLITADEPKTEVKAAAGEEEPWVCASDAAEAELYFPTGESKNVMSQETLLASGSQGSHLKTPTMARCAAVLLHCMLF